MVDNMKVKLERIYREKWVKKRGEEREEFEGHETLYKVNDVPHKQGEYQDKIESIIPEKTFKLLTNPFYFNTVLKWNERREMLSRMRNIQDEDVIEALPDLKEFFNSLDGTSIDIFRRELAEKIKLQKKSLAEIPARIDENYRKMIPDPDYGQVLVDLADMTRQIQEVEDQLINEAQKYGKLNLANQEKQNRIYELQSLIQEARNAAKLEALESYNEQKNQRDELRAKIFNAESRIVFKQELVRKYQSAIQEIEKTNSKLREEWIKKNEELLDKFDDSQFVCPTCKRAYETNDIEAMKAEMTANFNNAKAARLKVITETGKENNNEIEDLRNKATQMEEEISKFKEEKWETEQALSKFDNLPPEPTVKRIPQVTVWEMEIEKLRSAIKPLQAPDNKDLLERKEYLQKDLDRLNRLAQTRETNKEIQSRIDELELEKKSVSQEIAQLEKQQFHIQKFIDTKAKMTEEAVNGLFSIVRFKMFNRQVNGGLEETCEAMIDGVPFPAANKAAQINAGIDIINAFSKHLDTYAPIFTDNAEAVNEIIETDTQMIKLYVTRDKQLKIVTNEPIPIRNEAKAPIRRQPRHETSMA